VLVSWCARAARQGFAPSYAEILPSKSGDKDVTVVEVMAGDGWRSVGQLPFFTAAPGEARGLGRRFQSLEGGIAFASLWQLQPEDPP
jgi:hypothetical protein